VFGGSRIITLCLACAAVLLALPGSAAAAIGIASFSLSASTAQAGAHADWNLAFSFEDPGEPETAREASVELPPGFWLYPDAIPHCTDNQFATSECPISSQVGVVAIRGNLGADPNFDLGQAPVYLLAPEGTELARLVFPVPPAETPVEVPVVADPATGYSLVLLFEDLPEATPIASIDFELWGIPAAPDHDDLRFPIVPGGRPSNLPQAPFTRNPTACSSTDIAILHARSYEDPSEVSSRETPSPGITGCDKIRFEPFLSFQPIATTETATAAGFDLELEVPADLAPQDRSTSDTQTVSAFTLPGLQVNAAAASQRTACTLAQAHLDDISPAVCPAGSKLGAFTAAVGGVENPLEGNVYFGGSESSDSYRLFLLAASPRIQLKLPAQLSSDGGVDVAIPLPQLPLEELNLQVSAGTSLLTTAGECGAFRGISEVTPWSEPNIAFVVSTPFTIVSGPGGSPCPEAATSTPQPQPSRATTTSQQRPVVAIRRHPPRRGHDRTPSFRFTSSVAQSSFNCKLDRRPWRPCHSPLTLRRVSLGSHVFRVRAISPSGEVSAVALYRFRVVPARRAA
jgi:hypothetical protein